MISHELIGHLCKLARIDLKQDGVEKKLREVIDYVEALQEVDTDGVPECTHVIEEMEMELRDDEVGETLTTFLDNAPDSVGGMIRVPPVIHE